MANSSTLSPDSWQYRALNAVNPGLSYLSDALIDWPPRGTPWWPGRPTCSTPTA